MNRYVREGISRAVFAICAVIVVAAIAAIIIFIGSKSYQTFTVHHASLRQMLTGTTWDPGNNQIGALVLIVGSISSTVLAVLISAPISVGVAVFITEIAPPWARRFMQPVLELFTGIPSIIYGFLGLVILVPLVAKAYNSFFGGFYYSGYGLIPAALVLTIMILPTVTSVAVDTLAALPVGLRESSVALGATRWQTVRMTLLPAASSGIFTGIVLGTGRAIGETLAVSYVIGSNAGRFPFNINNIYPYLHFYPTSTITVQLLLDFQEVTPGTLSFDALWTLAFILLLISLVLVIVSRWIASRSAYNVRSEKPRRASKSQVTVAPSSPQVAEPRSVAG